MKIFIAILISLLMCLVIITGCNAPGSENPGTDNQSLPGNVVETADAYIVEGDISISKSSPDALQIALDFASSQSLSVYPSDINRGNLNPYKWSSTDQTDITYSFSTAMTIGSYTDAQIKTRINAALALYHSNANVTFRNVTSGGKITFSVVYAANGWSGMATTSYYPSTGTIASSAIKYNNYYLQSDTVGELSYTIYHEIGHSLGLAHEHQRADSSNQYGQGTTGTPYGAYDYNSVMDYANGSRITIPSYGDYASLKHLYNTQRVSYRAHVAGLGWLGYVTDCGTTGTTGQSRQMEAVQINLLTSGNISYRAHVAAYGWLSWVSSGGIAGTTGQSRQMEAIQIQYSMSGMGIRYRAHVAGIGWMGWAYNGAVAGTTGQNRRMEALIIEIYQC